MIEPRLLQGFSDHPPEKMILRSYVKNIWQNIFEKYGYGQLESPSMEYADILLGKYGEEEKLIYHFKDQGDRHIALRYDQTVSVARFVAQNLNTIKFPFKRYEINRVWRAEAARKGRKREFYQCDIDILGTESLLADAEIISILNEGFLRFNLPPHLIFLSHRKILAGFLETLQIPQEKFIEVNRSIDKLDKVGPAGVKKELEERGVPADKIPAILDFLNLKEKNNSEIIADLEEKLKNNQTGQKGLQDLKEIISYLKKYGLAKTNYKITPNLVRGLDYYTGVVFEVYIPELSQSALAGGGRYDNLCGKYCTKEISGVGVAVGFERLCEILEEKNLGPKNTNVSQVLVGIFNQDLVKESLEIAQFLRQQGINVENYLVIGDKLKKQFEYADKKNIPWVIIIGPEEAQKGVFNLKNMHSGAQKELHKEELIKALGAKIIYNP